MYLVNTKSKRRNLSVGLLGLALFVSGGCSLPLEGVQFREAALPAIQTGMSSILNGLLDGVFAAIEVENDTSETTAQ